MGIGAEGSWGRSKAAVSVEMENVNSRTLGVSQALLQGREGRGTQKFDGDGARLAGWLYLLEQLTGNATRIDKALPFGASGHQQDTQGPLERRGNRSFRLACKAAHNGDGMARAQGQVALLAVQQFPGQAEHRRQIADEA